MKKQKNKRATKKDGIIDPHYNLKSRSEELADIGEYFHKLSPKDQQWMLKYSENFVNASIERDVKTQEVTKNNLITPGYTKNLIESYLKQLKKKNNKDKVVDFIKKYLIRNDNVPIKVIQDIFFETDNKKILELVTKLKKSLTSNIKDVKKREVNKIIKIIEKEIYGYNNARNRCVLTREKAAGSLSYIEQMDPDEIGYNYEEALISMIDNKNLHKNDEE